MVHVVPITNVCPHCPYSSVKAHKLSPSLYLVRLKYSDSCARTYLGRLRGHYDNSELNIYEM